MATPSSAAGKQHQQTDLFEANQLRYEAYSRLQAAAVAFGDSCNLPIPEIVAIGGQSDGKSSLMEAFLGFKFQLVQSEMGTRRPLIVQMVHDPAALEPRCRLQDEDSEEYGPPIVPETAIADAILKRTQDHLKQLGNVSVSSKPIVMRAEYRHCPNLTIIDTPGFILKARNGEPDNTPDEIKNMVKQLAAPPHRLILFLQQSSVEWASSLWLKEIQELDPQFQRTVIVTSKFDNRLKEFTERWEVDKYLSATGYLPSNVKPFFIALPKDRNIQSSTEWRQQLGEVDKSILDYMRSSIKGGFDEERHGPRIGFGNLKRFLEDELARRYREAAPATLALLQERCEALAKELLAADGRLQACKDVAALRRAGMQHAAATAMAVQEVLAGCSDPDPAAHGMTSEEERSASNVQWPGCLEAVKPPNAGLRLFGGAAFERCLNEFQVAANMLAFPSAAVARDRVANVLLAYKGKNHLGGAARAAEDIARQTARELLGPLLDAAVSRLGFVLRKALDIAADKAMRQGPAKEALQPYVAFHAALRSAHINFVAKLEAQARSLLQHHLDTATSEFALSMMAAMPDVVYGQQQQHVSRRAAAAADETENMPPEEAEDQQAAQVLMPHRTPYRPIQMTVPETPSPEVLAAQQAALAKKAGGPGRHVSDTTPSKGRMAKSQRMDDSGSSALYEGRGTYGDVITYAERLFGRIRQAVACQAAPTTLKAAFLDPVEAGSMATEVALELFAKADADFLTLFSAAGAIKALQGKRDSLQRRCEGLLKCKAEFQEIARAL
ncbi:hypothetical protein OEZ86_012099 [Tetradesmus obliquus]|nr:hypothetical protein OEZ86_012099 [Tetradesmus obliquus]